MASIIVVGSINRDIVARVERHPSPGETVLGISSATHPGGKGANQAVAAARLRGRASDEVRMVGRVGRDVFGGEMRSFLANEGIDVAGVAEMETATGLALITVDAAGQNVITVVSGANSDWPDGCPSLELRRGDVVICQLEVPIGVVESAFAQARAVGATTVLNPAPWRSLPANLLSATDILVVNEIEVLQMVGRFDLTLDGTLLPAVRDIQAIGPRVVIVTLGASGVLVVDGDGRAVRLPGADVRAIDTTGAGDCFVGALAAALLDDDDALAAAAMANVAAAISVTRAGAATSMPRRAELIPAH